MYANILKYNNGCVVDIVVNLMKKLNDGITQNYYYLNI